MTTYTSAATCVEEDGTKKEQVAADAYTASVTLRCAWSDRMTIANDLIFNSRVWPYATGTIKPIAKQIAIAPAPASYTSVGQACEYSEALLTVSYTTEEIDLLSETLEPTAEFLTLDPRLFRWGSGAGEVLLDNEAPGWLRRGLQLSRTMYRVANIPATVLTLPGKCNSAAYTSALLGLTFAAETLLFGTPNIQRTFSTAGTKGFTLSMKFTYKESGWNTFWNERARAYQNIYTAGPTGTIYRPYPLGNFSDFLS